MKESDLAKYFTDYLKSNGYELWFEAKTYNGSITDIVGKMGNVYAGFEVKTSFGLAVLEQAFNNKFVYNYSYVCVPEPKIFSLFTKRLCEQYGIGVLFLKNEIVTQINKNSFNVKHWEPSELILEHIKPKLNRRIVKPELYDYMKESIAGSQSNRITSFGHMVREIKKHIARYPNGISIDNLFTYQQHYKTLSTFKNCLYQYIRDGVIDEIKLEKGIIKFDK